MDAAQLAPVRRIGPHYTNTQPSRYLLRLPSDDKAKGRTRATTFVKAIEDDNALKPWLATMAVTGVLRSTAVRSEWQSLMTRYPDPWYGGEESKARCKELVEKAQEAGGSAERRDTGTALHDILEAVGTGQADIGSVPDEWRGHVSAALELLDAEGFEIAADLCEQSVLNDRYGEIVIGRFDLMLRRKTDGRLFIGDYKTGGQTWRLDRRSGKWVDGYELSDGAHCAQMALYAGASSMIDWPEDKWAVAGLIPMPDVDQDQAVIIHLPSTEAANCSVRYLNLEVGRKHLEVCAAVRAVRKLKPLERRVGAVLPDAKPVTNPVPSDPFEGINGEPTKRDILVARLKALVTAHPDAGSKVGQHWPDGVPTFKGNPLLTDTQLEQIDKVITYVENEFDMPFTVTGYQPLAAPEAPRPEPAPPTWVPPDEGRPLADDEYDALKAVAAAAPEILDQWHRDAVAGRRPFSPRDLRSIRRAEIVNAAVACANHLHDPSGDDLLRAAMRAVTGLELQAGMTFGAALGSLTIDEARRLADLANRFGAGEVQPTTDDHGEYVFAN